MRVSILLPVHNARATLGSCLTSITRQSEGAFDCVIVDDGSTDGSLELARDWASRDPRFRVVAQPRRGLVPTLQHGVSLCRAPFTARMDADDIMLRHRLRDQLALLEAEPSLSAAGCHVRLFPRQAVRDGLRQYERWLNSIDSPQRLRREAFVECPIAHPTLFIRTAILRELDYRETGWPEDYDLILRLLEQGHTLSSMPRVLLCWRDGPARLSRVDPRYQLARFTQCRAHFLARGLLRSAERYVLWGYGSTGKALRKALLQHDKRPAVIVELHPGRLGQRIFGAEVIAPEQLRQLRDLPIVVSVAGARARGEIRGALDGMGFVELRDYLCCA